MEKLVDEIITCSFEDLKFITFPKNELFGLKLNKDGVTYEFLLNIKDNVDKLLILGSGARQPDQLPKDRKRPFFNRWSWGFNESTIHYNDPTTYIHSDLSTGWGIGTKNKWYLKEIALIIKEIGVKINIPQKNMIFLGSSAGGFTTIMLSTLIKDSIGISEIPQLNLKDYSDFHWNLLKKHIFLNMGDEEIFEKYGHRVDVITLFNKTNYIPKCYLILDCSVEGDLSYNYLPFFSRLNELPYNEFQNNLKIRIDGKNKGHCGSDYLTTRETIKKIISLEYGGKSYLDYISPSNGFSVINREEDWVQVNNGNNSIFVYENFKDNLERVIIDYKNKFQNANINETETKINNVKCKMVSLQKGNHYEYAIFLSRKDAVYSIKAFSFEKEVQKIISKIVKILN